MYGEKEVIQDQLKTTEDKEVIQVQVNQVHQFVWETRHVNCWTSSFKREHAPFLSNKFRTLKTWTRSHIGVWHCTLQHVILFIFLHFFRWAWFFGTEDRKNRVRRSEWSGVFFLSFSVFFSFDINTFLYIFVSTQTVHTIIILWTVLIVEDLHEEIRKRMITMVSWFLLPEVLLSFSF